MTSMPAPSLPASVPGATTTPEERGLERDQVRLLVSGSVGHRHARFFDLPELLEPGDLLVVNRSATLPAALPAALPAVDGSLPFRLHLCTRYGPRLWLAEPRWSAARPGPVPLREGGVIEVGGVEAVVLGAFPGIRRLRFFEFLEPLDRTLERHGSPIRYGYVAEEKPLAAYQTVFADRPGSAEMPSAGRPFTPRTLGALERRGVEVVRLTLHTGVSSLAPADITGNELYPEPFEVDADAAKGLNEAIRSGRRVFAIGTTTVRALASAWNGVSFGVASGMTRAYVRPGRQLPPLAGLLTGFHEPQATHLAMLEAVAGRELLDEGYREARRAGYLWHEFGDVHLLLTGRS